MKYGRLSFLMTVFALGLAMLAPFTATAQRAKIRQTEAHKVLQTKVSADQLQIAELLPLYQQRELRASRTILSRLNSLREQAKEAGWSFQVGYTEAMDYELGQLAGTKLPEDWTGRAAQQNEMAEQLLQLDRMAMDDYLTTVRIRLPDFNVGCRTWLSRFSWVDEGKITPVIGNQFNCGSCWAFAAMGAYEGSYAIRNNVIINASEKYVRDCVTGSCAGGWWDSVFQYMLTNGVATEADVPYHPADAACPTGVATPYRAVAWGFVTIKNDIPSVAELKQALCEHGPLAVGVYVSNAFQAYAGGVFDEQSNNTWINHGVTLVGWDDYHVKGYTSTGQAITTGCWLIKNSWGAGWGDGGYMWIEYGSNRIGYAAAWVRAKSQYYMVKPDIYTLIDKYYRIKPQPFPDPFQVIEPVRQFDRYQIKR